MKKAIALIVFLTLFSTPLLAHAEEGGSNSDSYKDNIIHYTSKELRQEMIYFNRKDELSELDEKKQEILNERYDEMKRESQKNSNHYFNFYRTLFGVLGFILLFYFILSLFTSSKNKKNKN